MNDLKRRDDQRDLRHKRAREYGDELVRRATDRDSLTDTEVEEAVARRWKLAPRPPARAASVESGLYEPRVRATDDPKFIETLMHRAAELAPDYSHAEKRDAMDRLFKAIQPRRPSWLTRVRVRFADFWRDVWSTMRGAR